MHVDRRFLNWGVFLAAVGVVPLAVRAGLVPAGVRWWELWPLLLVGWGIGLILGRTGLGLIGGAIVAGAIGLIVGGVLSTGSGFGGFGGACGSGSGMAFATQTGTFTASTASVDLSPGCGSVDVEAGTSGWQVSGTAPSGHAPNVDASGDGLQVRTADSGFDLFGSSGSAWQVRLPAQQPIDLSVTTNAGSARLALANTKVGTLSLTMNAGTARADFTGAPLTSLSVTANAGDARLTLPAATISGSLTANAGSIGLCVPSGTGIRIAMSGSFLGGNNFDERGLVHTGDTWTSPDFSRAATRIDLSATANAGAINVDPDGGCG